MMERQRRKDPSKNLVECIVGDVRYAITIGFVREIVNPLPTIPLPKAPAWVTGVANYRDEVVPVVDLRMRFGLNDASTTPRTKWIVLNRDGLSFALVVDAVTEVFRSGEVKPAPTLAAGAHERALEAVTTHDGDMVFILDVHKLAELVDPSLVEAAADREDARDTPVPPRRPD
jgi:purine-binding chemotaxis protein CheW